MKLLKMYKKGKIENNRLIAIDVPKNITIIEEQAFYNSTFESILFEKGSNLKEIKFQAF